MKKILIVFLQFAILLSASNKVAYASIPNRMMMLDLSKVNPVYPVDKSLGQDLIQKYLMPTSHYLSPTTDQKLVATQFQTGLSQTLIEEVFYGEIFRKSPMGKLTTKIEEAAEQSVVIHQPTHGVAQKINFNIKAMEKRAVLKYEGWVDSQVIYYMEENLLRASISKPLSESTTLSLTHVNYMQQVASEDTLSVNYTF